MAPRAEPEPGVLPREPSWRIDLVMPCPLWSYGSSYGVSVEVVCVAETGDKVTRDWQLLREFERGLISGKVPDPVKNLRIVEAMYEEARHLGVFPLKDPLEGLETDLRIARVVNLVREDPQENR